MNKTYVMKLGVFISIIILSTQIFYGAGIIIQRADVTRFPLIEIYCSTYDSIFNNSSNVISNTIRITYNNENVMFRKLVTTQTLGTRSNLYIIVNNHATPKDAISKMCSSVVDYLLLSIQPQHFIFFNATEPSHIFQDLKTKRTEILKSITFQANLSDVNYNKYSETIRYEANKFNADFKVILFILYKNNINDVPDYPSILEDFLVSSSSRYLFEMDIFGACRLNLVAQDSNDFKIQNIYSTKSIYDGLIKLSNIINNQFKFEIKPYSNIQYYKTMNDLKIDYLSGTKKFIGNSKIMLRKPEMVYLGSKNLIILLIGLLTGTAISVWLVIFFFRNKEFSKLTLFLIMFSVILLSGLISSLLSVLII